MKILSTSEVVCNVNGAEISVPYGAKYISIDMAGRVEIWTVTPYMSEGYWFHDTASSMRVAQVKMEDGDSWTKLYSVDNHCFVDTYYD